MIAVGPDDQVYPVTKIAIIVDALVAAGVSAADALVGVNIPGSALSSPATRVSLSQVIKCCRNATRLARDPRFAYRTGLRFHVTAYGLYGFAMLCSTDFRRTMRFSERYRQLATPITEISFEEEGDRAVWTIFPISHPLVNASVYRFLVELHFGIRVSLHRDVMGPSFVVRELDVTYDPPDDALTYPSTFGCPVFFNRPANKFIFDSAWLDRSPELGNEITYAAIVKLCDEQMEELQLRIGLVGKVREILLLNLMRPMSLDAVADRLRVTTRTLQRKLHEENTSFRKLVDELRMYMTIKYLRQTDLTAEDMAHVLGFSDAANFRHALRRWTKSAPLTFKELRAAFATPDAESQRPRAINTPKARHRTPSMRS